MLQQLESYPALFDSKHSFAAGKCMTVEMASHRVLNLAPATLSRTLADLQRRGSINRKGRRLTLRKSISPQSTPGSKRAPAATRLG